VKNITRYYSGDHIKEKEMNGSVTDMGRRGMQKFIQGFVGEHWREETTLKAYA